MNPSQTLLPLLRPPEPTLQSFVAGPNAEVLAAIHSLLRGAFDGEPVYLWGDHASGRSHLLRAFVAALADPGASVVDGLAIAAGWAPVPPLLVIDDVDRLSADAQVLVFDAINRGRAEGWRMLFSGPCPPARLSLRGELSSRLAQGLVLHLEHLSEAEKIAAMIDYAARAGFLLPVEVAEYLLRHGRRDLGTLLAVLQAIDQVSLRDHRPVSVRLAREVLSSADLFCPL